MESTRRPEVVDDTCDLEVALGRRWTIEDSRRTLRCVNMILIEGSNSSDEYHQVLEDQIRQHLTQLLGQNYKDYLVRDVLLLCEQSARDKGSFLQVSIDRSWSDDKGDEDDGSSSGGEILKHLVIRTCDEDTCYMAGDGDHEDEDAEICSICLEYLYQHGTTIATLKCWHEYHTDCIKKWLLGGQNFCPLCKKDATRHVDARSRFMQFWNKLRKCWGLSFRR